LLLNNIPLRYRIEISLGSYGRIGLGEICDQVALVNDLVIDPVHMVSIFLEIIVAQLKADVWHDEQADSHPDAQAQDIDGRENFLRR
jgi:hypothetical protein